MLKVMYSRNKYNDFVRVAWHFQLSTCLEMATVIVKVFTEPWILALDL